MSRATQFVFSNRTSEDCQLAVLWLFFITFNLLLKWRQVKHRVSLGFDLLFVWYFHKHKDLVSCYDVQFDTNLIPLAHWSCLSDICQTLAFVKLWNVTLISQFCLCSHVTVNAVTKHMTWKLFLTLRTSSADMAFIWLSLGLSEYYLSNFHQNTAGRDAHQHTIGAQTHKNSFMKLTWFAPVVQMKYKPPHLTPFCLKPQGVGEPEGSSSCVVLVGCILLCVCQFFGFLPSPCLWVSFPLSFSLCLFAQVKHSLSDLWNLCLMAEVYGIGVCDKESLFSKTLQVSLRIGQCHWYIDLPAWTHWIVWPSVCSFSFHLAFCRYCHYFGKLTLAPVCGEPFHTEEMLQNHWIKHRNCVHHLILTVQHSHVCQGLGCWQWWDGEDKALSGKTCQKMTISLLRTANIFNMITPLQTTSLVQSQIFWRPKRAQMTNLFPGFYICH